VVFVDEAVDVEQIGRAAVTAAQKPAAVLR
jgi:hypothetical protein